MGTVKRRERERQALRQLILDAARALFVQQGFEAVTMRKIAERIDYSATAIYHHFEDKDALIAALLEEDFQALLDALQRAGAIADPVARLRDHFEAYVDFALNHSDQYRLMFMTYKASPADDRAQAPMRLYAYFRDTVADCAASGAFRGDAPDVDALSQTLWGSLHGLVSLELLGPGIKKLPWVPLEERLRWLATSLGGGLFKEPDALLPGP